MRFALPRQRRREEGNIPIATEVEAEELRLDLRKRASEGVDETSFGNVGDWSPPPRR